jgi:hypothetical protein
MATRVRGIQALAGECPAADTDRVLILSRLSGSGAEWTSGRRIGVILRSTVGIVIVNGLM